MYGQKPEQRFCFYDLPTAQEFHQEITFYRKSLNKHKSTPHYTAACPWISDIFGPLPGKVLPHQEFSEKHQRAVKKSSGRMLTAVLLLLRSMVYTEGHPWDEILNKVKAFMLVAVNIPSKLLHCYIITCLYIITSVM